MLESDDDSVHVNSFNMWAARRQYAIQQGGGEEAEEDEENMFNKHERDEVAI